MPMDSIKDRTIDAMPIRPTAEIRLALRWHEVAPFGQFSGDLKPRHKGATLVLEAVPKGVVSHRQWATGLSFRLLENRPPDPGIVYVRLGASVHRPVDLSDTFAARIPARMRQGPRVVRIECKGPNPRDKPFMDGVVLGPFSVRHHDSFAALCATAARLAPVPAAVVHPVDRVSLQGVIEGARDGLIQPILVGPAARIRSVADEFGIDLSGMELIDVPHSHAAAERAVALIREGRAELLIKGSLHTDELLGAVRDQVKGICTDRRISHVFAINVPTYPRLLLVSDALIHLVPNLATKADICQNAIDFACSLGVERPKVAILSAVETIRPEDPSTLDAAALCRMAELGRIRGGILDGPLALDSAIDPAAARIKKIGSRVAGVADILIATDRESGNLIAKQLVLMINAEAAELVLGARVPIVLTSRTDSVRIRRAGVGVAVLHAHAARHGRSASNR